MGKRQFQSTVCNDQKSKNSRDANTILKRCNHTSTERTKKVSIHSQKRVNEELTNLIDQKDVIRVNKCSVKLFLSPIVITVTDQTVKMALKIKKLNIRRNLIFIRKNIRCQILSERYSRRLTYVMHIHKSRWINQPKSNAILASSETRPSGHISSRRGSTV